MPEPDPSTNLPPTFHQPSTNLCVPPPCTPVVVEHPSTRWNGWGLHLLGPSGGLAGRHPPLFSSRATHRACAGCFRRAPPSYGGGIIPLLSNNSLGICPA